MTENRTCSVFFVFKRLAITAWATDEFLAFIAWSNRPLFQSIDRFRLVAMATVSSSAHLELVHYIPQSLTQVQIRWFVRQQTSTSTVGGPSTVQISITDHAGDEHREWICERAAGENVEDFYDVPSHVLVPGHNYEICVKLMSRDQSSVGDEGADQASRLMQVLHTKTLNFRLSEYTMYMAFMLTRINYYFTKSRRTKLWMKVQEVFCSLLTG